MKEDDIKQQLSMILGVSIVDQKLTRIQASKKLHIDATRLSKILNGNLYRVSLTCLFSLLNGMGLDVEITVKPKTGDEGTMKLYVHDT